MANWKKRLFSSLVLLPLLGMLAFAAPGAQPSLRPLRIQATDAAGEPVSGLRVLILPADGSSAICGDSPASKGRAETGVSGIYEAGRYEAGRSYTVTLANTYSRPVSEQSHTFRLEKGEQPYPLALRWEQEKPETSLAKIPQKLVLHVVDEKGEPVRGLYARGGREHPAYPDGTEKVHPGTDGQLGFTDFSGRLIFVDPAIDSYTLSFNYPPAEEGGAEQTFSVPYSGGSREYTLPLLENPPQPGAYADPKEYPLRDVAIRVLDPSGNAVPDVVASALPLKTEETKDSASPLPLRAKKTNRDGIYRAQAAIYGSYALTLKNNLSTPVYTQKHRLFVQPFQGTQLHTVIFAGEPPLTTLEKRSQKLVLFFKRAALEPANGLRVEVRKSETGRLVSDGWTDYEGKYILLEFEPAAYELWVEDEGKGLSGRYAIDATGGTDLSFTLSWPPQS
ncbi:MAG: hypothetical protein HFG26_09300 [Provencibacterium sp.]|jgi:hypothetical protein|nr:hypothetical protein [Provencibacterium sp.]